MRPLANMHLAVFVGDDYEDMELWVPYYRLVEAGAKVSLVGTEARKAYRSKHGYPCESSAASAEVRSAAVQGVVIPGGWMPDKLRRDPHVLQLVRECALQRKLIASICHGPWINVSAGVCRGVRMTGSPGVKDDVVNAGGAWEDAAVVADRHYVTSRKPADLPDFCAAMLAVLTKAPEGRA